MMIRVTLIVTPNVMALLGRIIMSCIMICMARHDCGVFCVSRGDAGVVPYWSGDEEGDVHEGDVALPRTGSDEPVDMLGYSVVSTFGSGGRVAPVMRKVTFMRVMLPCPRRAGQ